VSRRLAASQVYRDQERGEHSDKKDSDNPTAALASTMATPDGSSATVDGWLRGPDDRLAHRPLPSTR